MIAPAGNPDVEPVPPLATGSVPVIVLPERLIVLFVSVVVLVAVTMLVGVMIVDRVVIVGS
jgi:hypothetical protein